MLSNVFVKSIRDLRKSTIWWSFGLVSLTVLTQLFYPSVSSMTGFNELLTDDSLIKAFVGDVPDLTSPEGYLNSQLFFMMIPLIFIIFSISQGSGAVAGEEEKGTLDLLMSNPLDRWRVVLEKFAAFLFILSALATVTWLGIIGGALIVDMEISYARVGEVTLAAAVLGATFGALALAIGNATGRRNLSIAISSGIGVAGYFINALAPVVDLLRVVRKFSPFHYYSTSDPLTNGIDFWHLGTLLSISLVLIVIAVLTFQRRDLGT